MIDALDVVEAPRAAVTGAERERALYFSRYRPGFDQAADWSLQLGDVEGAFDLAERARNRSFLDQLNQAQVDLTEGTDPQLVLRERETALTLASLEADVRVLRQELEGLRRAETQSPRPREHLEQGPTRRGGIEQALRDLKTRIQVARQENAEARTRRIDASPLARNYLAREPDEASSICRKIVEDDKLLLFYSVGKWRSHLYVVRPGTNKPLHFSLDISRSDRKKLAAQVRPLADHWQSKPPARATASREAVGATPLTREAAHLLVTEYHKILHRAPGAGEELGPVKAAVTETEEANRPWEAHTARIGAPLARILLPEAVRELIRKDRPRYVVVVPDGALHDVPFEALVLGEDRPLRYLLDDEDFPPIVYASSLNSFAKLLERALQENHLRRDVLMVRVPDESPQTARAWVETTARLRNTVQTNRVDVLLGPQATEANVRRAMTNRWMILLHAHGVPDLEHDNLYGNLNLFQPHRGRGSGAGDDLLSLGEILGLELSGCELAILSACETNVGPRRGLETSTTLARAFLVAGSTRVIASHWRVNIAGTQELMRAFLDSIADQMTKGETIRYGQHLQTARRRLKARGYRHPYYWAPFVMLGPPE